MNFRYKTIVFSLLMSGMTLVSCDDFLTQENIHQLTTQNFYKTIGDCEKALAAESKQAAAHTFPDWDVLWKKVPARHHH